MDLDRYLELRALLQQWRTRLAESIRRRIENGTRRLAHLQAIYDQEGADEAFTTWLDRWCRQAAIQFILRILFLRVLEDRDLLGATRLRTTDGQQMWAQLTRNLGVANYVQWCCWDAAHLLPDLFGPNDYDLVLPDDALVQRFLNDVWRRPDPNREGWLRFDFRADPARGDEGFQTHFIGDLYQELDAEIRKRYALLQTPHFISQFILEHTLLKRFEEKDFRQVTLIDPTCGSGHILVDAFWMFVERYEAALGVKREERATPPAQDGTRTTHHESRATLSPAQRAEIARTVIEQHLFGCDINPYATELARFRLLLAACDYARPTSLRSLRDLRFNLVTIDSLIPYERLGVGEVHVRSELTHVLGQPEAIRCALPVLRKRYDVVVGNPPYITARDRTKRDLYREHYVSAYRSFGLSAPFTERFLQMTVEGGLVGLIESNAFARRQFGKKLIEKVLPNYDLLAVVDLSGAYVPGHGTPTLILLARSQSPSSNKVLVLSNIRGEPGAPVDPSRGRVWQSVLRGYAQGHGYQDEYVDVYERLRRVLNRHPWEFGGPAARLYERVVDDSAGQLRDFASDFGYSLQTNADEVFCVPVDYARRLVLPHKHLRQFALGECSRDWSISRVDYIVFPYNDDLDLVDIEDMPALERYLAKYRTVLGSRVVFGGETYLQADKPWYAYHQFSTSKHSADEVLSNAFIATHNHFLVDTPKRLFNRSAPVVLLPGGCDTCNRYRVLAGIMNSSLMCFCLKQTCFDKRAGKYPVRDTYYEFASTNISQAPIPHDYETKTSSHDRMLSLTNEMIAHADRLSRLAMRKLFEQEGEAYYPWNRELDGYIAPPPDLPAPFTSARELRAARDKLIQLHEDIRGRMIFLQEEMDWIAYDMYGLLKGKPPLAEDYLSPAEYQAARLHLGQRPFEVAGRDYQGDWPAGYQPPPLPEPLRSLTEARITVIKANPDIAMLEDSLYKRRWIPPDYEAEFRQAAAWWLAEKLEWALEQHGRPISLREWVHVLGQDERVIATLEVLTSTPSFDLERELLRVIRANAVPDRPEHYLKSSGLRKLQVEGAEFKSTDFSDATAWRLRGKLNIPRERFIHYAGFDHTLRGANAPETGGPWFGWAGWNEVQRAEALADLIERASRAGWEMHYRQCGLRAALRELLPQIEGLSDADRAEFQAIAEMCGLSLGTPCYCQAYRDGVARGEPGVPGVTTGVLEVRVPLSERKHSRQRRVEKGGVTEEQLALELRLY